MLGTVCMRLFSPYPFVLIMLVHVNIGESLLLNSCPENIMWNLRAKSLCGDKNKYMCLYDTNERKFRELCKDKPDFHRSGNIFVISGNLQYFAGRSCYSNRYQPHKWWTNGSSDCQYLKSMCNGEGQVPFDNGTISRDRKCRCDYTNYYTFLKNSTMNRCHCDPTEEDCSCYLKKCKIDEVLTPDYDCVNVHAWTGVFVCPEHKASIFTKEKILPRRTTVCPLVIRDFSGTMQQTSARIAHTAMFGVILIFGLLNVIVFAIIRKTRKLSREDMEKELKGIKGKMEFIDESLKFMNQQRKDSIIENTARYTLDQENEIQDKVLKREVLNKQVCIDVLEQKSGDKDLTVTVNSASSMSSLISNTVNSHEENIKRIIRENKWETCALVLCILFYDGFNTDWLTLKFTPETKKAKLQDIVSEFKIDFYSENSMFALKSAFSSLNDTYLISQKGSTEYKIINAMIYQQVSVKFGNSFTKCFIKYASSSMIRDQFLFESFKSAQIKDDLILLSEDEEGTYFERLLRDIRESNYTSTFHNKQLQYPPFMDKLIRFYKKNEDAKQVLKDQDINGRTVEDDDRNSRCSSATTPLIESASGGYVDMVNFLIDDVKSDINNRDGTGKTALYKASEEGNTTVVQLLVVKNADVNQCNMYNESPLYVACKEKHRTVVDILLQNNASVNQYTSDNKSLLHAACVGGCHGIVELLLKRDVNMNRCDINIESPLYVACALGNTDIVEALLQTDAKVDQCDIFGQSPLYVSCAGGYTDIVHRLLAKGANVNKCNRDEETPLYMACTGGYRGIVEKLLQKDADVSKCDSDGKSPLHVACGGGYKDVVDLLLNANANVNQYYSKQKEFPLYLACAGGYTDIIEMLLKKEANVSQYNSEGKSPLFVACTMGYTAIVELLLKWDAKVSQCNCTGASPLYVACAGGRTDIVKLLLQNNPDVSQCSQSDKSPLHVVCDFHLFEHLRYRKDIYEKRVKDHIKIVELLISCNVDLNKMDLKNRTPLDIAKQSRCSELVNLLQKQS